MPESQYMQKMRQPLRTIGFWMGYTLAACLVYAYPLDGVFRTSIHTILVNYCLSMSVFAVVLYLTAAPRVATQFPKLPNSKRRFLLLILSYLLLILLLTGYWLRIGTPLSSKTFTESLLRWSSFLPPFDRGRLMNAINGIYIAGFSVIVGVWLMGRWRRQSFRFRWNDVFVTLAMMITAVLLTHFYHFRSETLFSLRQITLSAVVGFCLQFFVNGFQEETYFRGYVFPQLQAWLHWPVLSCWGMVVLFDASHLPSFILGQHMLLSWWRWVLFCLFPPQPTGWLFALIFYRTRSVLPGALFHTYTTLWSFPFL